jgi:hypothetical protein
MYIAACGERVVSMRDFSAALAEGGNEMEKAATTKGSDATCARKRVRRLWADFMGESGLKISGAGVTGR